MHKVLSKQYSVPNVYENFGGGELSPGKIEFGVVVVRGLTVGNVVQNIPSVDPNRDDHVQFYRSGPCIPIAPILGRKVSSTLVPA